MSRKLTPQNIMLILAGLITWFSLISSIGGIYLIISKQSYSLFFIILEILIFLLFLFGLIATFKLYPPFHYLILIGALVNLIFSYITISSGGFLQMMLSLLIIYLFLRFPINFEYNPKALKK